MSRAEFALFIILVLALLAGTAACSGGHGGTTSTAFTSDGASALSTNYVITVVPQGGKSTAAELTFAKTDEPVSGEDAVARFEVTPADTEFARPVLLRVSYLGERPGLDIGDIYAVKRLVDGRATPICFPSSSDNDMLLSITGSGEYLVTREARATVSQAGGLVVFASADSAGGDTPHTVNFSAWTDDDLVGVSYHWEFGDGEEIFEQNPTHTYTSNGSYIVTLTATLGGDTFTAVSTPIDVGAMVSALSGYVLDTGSTPLEGVVVTVLTESGVVASMTTDSEGYYSFADLPQRTYCVAFTLDGYRSENLVANLDEGTEVLDAQMVVHAEALSLTPVFWFNDPPYILNESTGVAEISGSVTEFYGDEIAVSVNGAIRSVAVSGTSFFTEVVLRPGNNDILFIAANEIGATVSDTISIYYEASGTILFRATLTWDGEADIDLHCVDPNGEHCYFGNDVISTGNLDVDNVVSYGPENFTCVVPEGSERVPGIYHIYVNYYSGSDPQECTITLLLNPGTPREEIATFGPYTLDTDSLDWYAVNVDVGPSGFATYDAPGSPPDGA
jgi:hypothetical protein